MSKMFVLFGVKTSDMEEARDWIETTTGEKAGAPYHNDYIGDYYLFRELGTAEQLKLCVGTSEDEDGKYPTEPEHSTRALLVYLDQTNEESDLLKALESRPDRFEKLQTDNV